MIAIPIGPSGVAAWLDATTGFKGIFKVAVCYTIEFGFFSNVFPPKVVPAYASYNAFVVG